MSFRGKKITIIGMGRSALGAAKLMLREGALPLVSDHSDGPALSAWKKELEDLKLPYETGGHSPAALEETDMIVLSPGVPPSLEIFSTARENGIPVLGELELAWHFCKPPVLAVTGTNGKTTTTELLRAMIAACGHSVILAGNNDTPFSTAVMTEPAPEYIVLEVSSYQLETVRAFHPWIAAVLNLSPDHLGRHGSMENYALVKERIFARQGLGDVAIVNGDDDYTQDMSVADDARLLAFSTREWSLDGLWFDGRAIRAGDEPVALASDIPLPGRHNLENVLAALTMARAAGFSWEKTLEGLRSFAGVEHRLEAVATIDEVRYINDSKSTNIDSLRVALDSFEADIVLIAGGEGKGSDYGVLRPQVEEKVKSLITLGKDAPKLEAAFAGLTKQVRVNSIADAVRESRLQAAPGDVVLLSPGCASFDMYANFEERGRDFKRCVRCLVDGGYPKQGESE